VVREGASREAPRTDGEQGNARANGDSMIATTRFVMGAFLLGLTLMNSGCVVEPREGYYDHSHARWYHEHRWHECGEHEDHCR
jgi:hypothetical protein